MALLAILIVFLIAVVWFYADHIYSSLKTEQDWNKIYRSQIALGISHLEAVKTANKAVYR